MQRLSYYVSDGQSTQKEDTIVNEWMHVGQSKPELNRNNIQKDIASKLVTSQSGMSQVYGRKKHHRPWTTFHSGRGNRLGQEKHGERTITNADELAFVPYINQIIKK